MSLKEAIKHFEKNIMFCDEAIGIHQKNKEEQERIIKALKKLDG